MIIDKNKFSIIAKKSLVEWHASLMIISLPCIVMLNIDSMIKWLTTGSIIVDISFIALLLGLIATIIALTSASIIFIFNKYKLTNISRIASLALNVTSMLIASYYVIKLLRLWISMTGVVTLNTLDAIYKILIVFILIILGVVFNEKFERRLQVETNNIVKISSVVIIVSVFIICVRIVAYYTSDNSLKTLSLNANKKHPNIILVSFDALTAENMSLYKYSINTTPNIDKFGQQSYVFNNMYSNSNWTKPGVVSTLTGTLPSKHGLISRSIFNLFSQIPINSNNLPGILKLNGYNTSAVVSNFSFAHPYLNDTYNSFDYKPFDAIENEFVSNYKQSFEILKLAPYFLKIKSSFFQWVIRSMDQDFPFLTRSVLSYFVKDRWDRETPCPAALTFRVALNHMNNTTGPTFTWIHILPPHEFYLPPLPFKYSLLPEKILDSEKTQSKIILKRIYGRDEEQAIGSLRLRYDENIKYADYEFGQFLDMLKKNGNYDNSIIILTADHGECFEKGYVGHGGPLSYQPLIHIPLIIHVPQQVNGKRIECNAEQADIAPTIIDLLGLRDPGWFDGESLTKAIFNDYMSDKPKYSMNLENNVPGQAGALQTRTVAVIKNQYKYIYYIDKDFGELFNLSLDPNEKYNLVQRESKIADKLRALIVKDIMSSKVYSISSR